MEFLMCHWRCFFVAGCYGVCESLSVVSSESSASMEPWFCDACRAGVKPVRKGTALSQSSCSGLFRKLSHDMELWCFKLLWVLADDSVLIVLYRIVLHFRLLLSIAGKTQPFTTFIYSYYFYSASSSPPLLRSAPDRARILCQSFTPKCHSNCE